MPLEVHDAVFVWVLKRLAEHGLIQGDRIGVDASTMEAHAALRAIVRRDSGEGYREMLKRLAKESGIETPTADDLVRLDRQRPGKKLSNEDWQSESDPDARIAKMKDGRTRLAYQPEHAAELIADKGYHSRDGLKDLEDSQWKSRISEPKPNGILRRKGDGDASGPMTTTAPACSPASRAKPSSCAPSWSDAPSPSPWIGAACAGPGYAAETICKSDI